MIRRFEDYEGNRVACALRHASKAYWAIYDAAVSLSKRKLAAGLRSGYGIKPLCEFTGLPPIDVRDWVPTFREIVTELKYLSDHTDYGDLYETQEDIWWLCQFICEYERVKAQAAQSVGKKQTARAFLNIAKLVEPLCGREEVTISKKGEPRIWEYRYSFCDEKNKATWFDTLLSIIELDTEATAELNGENKAQENGEREMLERIENKLDETHRVVKRGADAAEIAATRQYKQLKKQSDAGRRGAKLAKATTWVDPKRKSAITKAKRRINNGEKPEAVYSDLAGSWTTPQGNPISAEGVKKAVQRAREEKRGNRSQKGKTRGQYRTIGHTNR